MTNKKTLQALIIFSLSTLVGYLTKLGIVYKISFTLVFAVFDLLLLAYIKKRLEKIYGKARTINIFAYGMGAVFLFVFILLLLDLA